MRLKYQKYKGDRIKKQFIDMSTFDGYWFDFNSNKWVKNPILDMTMNDVIKTKEDKSYNNLILKQLHSCSSELGCNSIKSFRRKLCECSKYLPAGTRFVLTSKWEGYDVIGYTN